MLEKELEKEVNQKGEQMLTFFVAKIKKSFQKWLESRQNLLSC